LRKSTVGLNDAKNLLKWLEKKAKNFRRGVFDFTLDVPDTASSKEASLAVKFIRVDVLSIAESGNNHVARLTSILNGMEIRENQRNEFLICAVSKY